MVISTSHHEDVLQRLSEEDDPLFEVFGRGDLAAALRTAKIY